jgi:histone deacetylase 1/2
MPTWGSVKNRSDYPEWLKAWDTECNAMKKLGVLEECDEPYGKPVAGSTLVCKIKRLWNGAIDKYRVRWVLQGFSQTYGVNFFDTSSPVIQGAVVRLVACIMTVTNCVALQCDVPVAYLRSELHEELWMYPPKGTPPLPPNPRTGKRRCYRVKRAIYGCKQGSIEWFKTFSKKQFLQNGYRQCPFDTCLFIKRSGIFFLHRGQLCGRHVCDI